MKKLAYVGSKNDFYNFISKSFSGEIVCFDNMEIAGRAALDDDYISVIAVAEKGTVLSPLTYTGMETFASLQKAGKKVYAEMYDSGDYNSAMLFGFLSESSERKFYNENLVWNGKLLQARCQSYIPGRLKGAETIAGIEDCIGSYEPVIEGTQKFPAVIRKGTFIYSALRLSGFDRITMLPYEKWCELYAEIFSFILSTDFDSVKKAFKEIWPKPMTAGAENNIKTSVRSAVDWHFNSGIITDNGKNGCYEMIRSHDLAVRCNNRVDVMLITSALMYSAGKYYSDIKLTECGKNIAEHCFDKEVQEKHGPNKGIFHWYETFGLNEASCYTSDNGRDGMAMLQLYRITGEKRYLESVKALGEAYLKWTGSMPYFKTAAFKLSSADLDTMPIPNKPTSAPVFYEGMAIVLANLYRITGDMRYKAQLKLTADALYSDYPNYSTNFSPLTKSFLLSRLMTVLCAAQEIGCGNYSSLINELIDFFESHQKEDGGIEDSEIIMTSGTMKHPEFSVSMGYMHDSIIDNLYCLNNILGCLSLISSMSSYNEINVKKAEMMRNKLVRFTMNIQISEKDDRLNGGWMRAYDLTSKSYFGVNKDKDWGAYCIMGGWVMGFIPLLLMAEDGIPSIYSIDAE